MFALELAEDGYGVQLMYQTDEALDGPWCEVDGGILGDHEAGEKVTGESATASCYILVVVRCGTGSEH